MKNPDCEIIRDLMPLCLDGEASEQSKSLVLAHREDCAECAAAWKSMQEAMQQIYEPAPVSAPNKGFEQEVRQLQKARRKRRWRAGLLGALLGILIILLGAWLVHCMRTEWVVNVPTADYDLLLSRRANGDVILTRRIFTDAALHFGANYRWTLDNSGTITYRMSRYILPDQLDESQRNRSEREDYLVWRENEGLYYAYPIHETLEDGSVRVQMKYSRIDEIIDAGEVIYRHGDLLPLASEELEAYMQVYDEYKGTREALWEQEMADLVEDEQQRFQRLTEAEIFQEKREAIEDTIPEWQ